MQPKERRDAGQTDLFRARLDQILDMKHALVKLAGQIDWGFLEKAFGETYEESVGRPALATRLMAGLAILKHSYSLSDEGLCERYVENPYFQFFCGEEFFQHEVPFDRSSLTRWRQRMGGGEEKLEALIQESLAVATRTGALRPADLSKVIIDTTVQPKAVTFPTDAKLAHRARERLVRLARKHKIELRQSYQRVGKAALIRHQRYAHAKQFKRANRELRMLKTQLRRVIRDITRKIKERQDLHRDFARPLWLSQRVHDQKRGQRGPKIYSLHAPEVECIGKGKPHKPYEFGVKVSVATTLNRAKGGQFVTHIKALPGNPYDGHTLASVIPDMERTVGATIQRILTDAGYRGHNAPPDSRFKIYMQRQKRGVTDRIKRELRRRSAIEPVIGHLKSDHRMDRNYLALPIGDANNAVLAAAGYNFRRLLNWLRLWLVQTLTMLIAAVPRQRRSQIA